MADSNYGYQVVFYDEDGTAYDERFFSSDEVEFPMVYVFSQNPRIRVFYIGIDGDRYEIKVEKCEADTAFKIDSSVMGILNSDEFLKEFRKQLFRLFGYSLSTFAEDELIYLCGTTGWHTAFGAACMAVGHREVFDYYEELSWDKSDHFDSIVCDLLVERGYMLGSISDLIVNTLTIPAEDLRVCNDCEGIFTKDMGVEICEEDEDEILISNFRCRKCQDEKLGLNYFKITRDVVSKRQEDLVNADL